MYIVLTKMYSTKTEEKEVINVEIFIFIFVFFTVNKMYIPRTRGIVKSVPGTLSSVC